MAALNFDASQVVPATGNELMPAGDYRVMVVDSAMQPTKTGGGMLVLTFTVLDGQFQGNMLWTRLNLVNANSKAVEIAQRELSAICHAVGVMQVQDSAQLHNRPLIVRVAVVESDDPKYGPKNEIKKYSAIQGATTPAAPSFTPPATQAPVPAATPSQSTVPPWGAQTAPAAQAPQPAAAAPANTPPWARKAA